MLAENDLTDEEIGETLFALRAIRNKRRKELERNPDLVVLNEQRLARIDSAIRKIKRMKAD